MKIAIVTGSILCLLATRASAQPYTPPAAPAEPPPAPVQPGAPKSETTALLLSLGGTLLPVGLAIGAASSTDSPRTYSWLAVSTVVSATFGPSIGHWYAGKGATRGLGLRLAGGATALLGVGLALAECPISFSGDPCEPGLGIVLLAIGGAVFVGGMVDDVVTAPRRVWRYNQERGFGVAPVVTPSSTGLALGGRF